MPFITANDNVPIYYQTKGKKGRHALILIHAYMANHLFWQKNVDELAQAYQVIAPDLRGHGFSGRPETNLNLRQAAEDIHMFIDALQLQTITLVGWSMGTYVVYEYLRAYSKSRIKGCVLIDMPPRMIAADDWPYGSFDSIRDAVEILRLLNKDPTNTLKKFVPVLFAKDKTLDESTFDFVFKNVASTSMSALMSFWIDMVMADYRHQIVDFPLPVLLCHGDKSAYPAELGNMLHQQFPQSTLVMFENSGHSPQWEEPEKFNQSLRHFVDSL